MAKNYHQAKFDNRGVIAMITMLIIGSFALAIMGTVAALAISELKMAEAGGALEETFYAAEAGLNEALYRLIKNPLPEPYAFEFNGYQIEAATRFNPDNPYQRILTSTSTSPNGKVRVVELIANSSGFGSGFDYAVQGGNGGIFLDNNSLIIGNVYSNSNIKPASGGATGEIQGNVWVAGSNLMDKVKVSGSVHAYGINRSEIAGSAFYFDPSTIDAATKVGGSPCPNSYCFPNSPTPLPKTFPIGDSDVQTWKDEIDVSDNPVLTPNPATCPASHPVGFYCIIGGSQTLGNQKIVGDFYVGNGATLTLTGNVWVTGKIILDNNGTIQINPNYCDEDHADYDQERCFSSVVIIADGIVDVNNNYTISGTGNVRSFILILSMSTQGGPPTFDPDEPAIYASNNSTSVVFGALHGMLKVKNNGALNAAAAEALYLEPNSEVTFNPFLTSFNVPSGGDGEPVGTAIGTWQEK